MRGSQRSETLLPRIARAAWVGRWAIVVGLGATMLPAILLTLSHDQPHRAEGEIIPRYCPVTSRNARPGFRRSRIADGVERC